MKIWNFDEFYSISKTTFEHDDVIDVPLIGKDGPAKIEASGKLIFDPMTEEGEICNSVMKICQPSDYIFIKAFGVDVSVTRVDIGLLAEHEAVLFNDGDIIVAALFRVSLYEDGFRFGDNLSYSFLNSLLAKDFIKVPANFEIDDGEYFAYEDEMSIQRMNRSLVSNKKRVVYSFADKTEDVPIVSTVDPSFDYICFSNSMDDGQRGCWRIVKTLFSEKFMKNNPFRFLSSYDMSVWAEVKTTLKSGFGKFADLIGDEYMLLLNDDECDSAYDKIGNCEFRKILFSDDYPAGLGMTLSDILVRRHNERECIQVMKNISFITDVYDVSFDVALNYSLWKHGGHIVKIPNILGRLAR